MKYLGIDYGRRKVGLAVSYGEIADPFRVVEVTSLADALQKVKKVIFDEGIEKVIIGLPESGEALNMVKKFTVELASVIEVELIEETLSSHKARELMIEMGVSQSKRGLEDAYSASLILQSYLDSIH